jgi:hypothetical protein
LRVLVVFLIGFIVILIINQLFISNKLQKNEIGKIGIASTITNPKTIIGESFHDSISYPETLEDEKIKDTNTINSQKEPLRNKQKPFIEQLSENDTIGNNAFCIINDENEIMDISLSFDGYQYQTFSLKPKQPNYFVFWNYSNHYFVHTEGHLRVCTLATDSCVGVIMALSKKYKIRWNKKKKRQDIFFAFFSVDFQPRSPVECLLNNKTMTGCPSFPG